MNHREALAAQLKFEKPSLPCQFEWGYWPETITRWQQEGMPGNNPWDTLDITYYDRVPVQVRMYPGFKEQVLEEKEHSRIIRGYDGVVAEVSKEGTAFPRFIRHPVETMADFEALKEHLNPLTPGRFPDNWKEAARNLARRSHVLVMGAVEISFFGWHRDLMGVESLLMAYYDEPELIHAISRQHLDFIKEIYSRILKDVTFDFIFIWEDMSFKNGPLISPDLVREFMLPYYREMIGFFREFGDYKFLLDSDGDVNLLIPLFREVGVDGMLPFEVAAGMDVVKIGEQYPDFILSGGIDKRVIALGKDAIDREIDRLRPLFKRGGYLPSMDHHVPPEVNWPDFQYYLERVRKVYRECR